MVGDEAGRGLGEAEIGRLEDEQPDREGQREQAVVIRPEGPNEIQGEARREQSGRDLGGECEDRVFRATVPSLPAGFRLSLMRRR